MTDGKKHILFDANSLVQNRSGVGQFSERLLTALAAQNDTVQITAYYFNFLGRKRVTDLPNLPNVRYKAVRFLPTKLLAVLHRLTIQLPLEGFLRTKGYDFIIFPNFVSIPSLRKIPYAVAVHDLSFKDCPDFLTPGNRNYLARFVGRSVTQASFVVTISDFTKQRIAHWYGEKIAKKTIVISVPYEPHELSGVVSNTIKSLAQKPFFLFVGTIEPRKNIANLVRAFSVAQPTLSDNYRLILAGGVGWNNNEIHDTLRTQNNDNIVLTGYISDAERDYLYRHCSAVCMVSHYEGFGMPILEAFYYHKPVLASSIQVFKEVAGSKAVYADPASPDDIARGMIKVVKARQTKTKVLGSWQQNAKTILEEIEQTS